MSIVTNINRLFSCEGMLHRNLFEAQGVNHYHNDLIQCYAMLSESMGWESIYSKLVKTADCTVENERILTAAHLHLKEIKKLRSYDYLVN